jgi:hypothetical protein
MNLRQEILKEHSKDQCKKIVDWIGSSQKRFDELFRLFINDEYRVVQRAAWPISNAVMANPTFIESHFEELIKKLKQPALHGAVRRNGIRLLQEIKIPEKWQGDIMNICFDFLNSPIEAVAVKAFCITVLGNMAQKYPEIIPELRLAVEDQLPHQTAAFKVRARDLFIKLKLEPQ